MSRAMTQTALNLKTAPAHVVLAAEGKTVLRPGGRAATKQLFQWVNFQPGETVLELASGLGNSAITLAKLYSVQVVGIEKDPNRVAIAQLHKKGALQRVARQLTSHIEVTPGLSKSRYLRLRARDCRLSRRLCLTWWHDCQINSNGQTLSVHDPALVAPQSTEL